MLIDIIDDLKRNNNGRQRRVYGDL